jgi:hypothetical protein
MKTKRLLISAIGLALICATVAFMPNPADQDKNTDLEKRIQKLEARIEKLEQKLAISVQTGQSWGTVYSNPLPLPGSVESRLKRLEKEVFDPDVKVVPCEE